MVAVVGVVVVGCGGSGVGVGVVVEGGGGGGGAHHAAEHVGQRRCGALLFLVAARIAGLWFGGHGTVVVSAA